MPHLPLQKMTSIISTKIQPTGTKRKQIQIDALLPKKRVCETQTSASSHSDSPSTIQAFSFPNCNVTPTTEKSDTEMPRISKEIPGSPDIWPDDIHNFVNLGSRLPESKKYDILFRHWKPESDYYFPPDENTGTRFQYECLTRFPWLAYSAAENGSFCINCVLFGGESTHNSGGSRVSQNKL